MYLGYIIYDYRNTFKHYKLQLLNVQFRKKKHLHVCNLHF